MKSMYFGLLIYFLIGHTGAQTFICNAIPGYDTKALTGAVQWEVTTDYQCLGNPAASCTYYISFCQPGPICFDEYSACQNATGVSNVTIIGGVTQKLFYENETGEGFYAKFPAGPVQNISNTTVCKPSLTIQFNCDQDTKWSVPLDYNITGLAPEPIDINIDPNDPCSTIMFFNYSGACFNETGNITSTTSTTTLSPITTVTTPSTGNTFKPITSFQYGLVFLMTLVFQQLFFNQI